MNKFKTIRTTSKKKKKLGKLYKKLPFGESFTLDSMIKMAITFKNLLNRQPTRSGLLRKLWMTIFCKSEMGRSMASILTTKLARKLVSLEPL